MDAQIYSENCLSSQRDKIVPYSDPGSEIYTVEDSEKIQKGLPLPRYDAYLLYSDLDWEFVSLVIKELETIRGMKLCIKERDLLPGVQFEHEGISKLIESRCNHLLVIFSPNFLNCGANSFLLSYAQALALDTSRRKIIPCKYKDCELPPSVRYSYCLSYERNNKLWNFWDKLAQSVGNMICFETEKQGNLAMGESSVNVSKVDTHWWDVEKTTDGGKNKGTEKMTPGDSLETKESKTKWYKKIAKPMSKFKGSKKDDKKCKKKEAALLAE